MGVRLRFRGGPLAGKVWEFGDDVEEIVVGRDPDRCQVVVPEAMAGVGRQHFALKASLGRYRLVLNRDNPVYVDGKVAMDGMELPPAADVTLGKSGPRLTIMTLMGENVPETVRSEKAGPGIRTRLERTEGSSKRTVKLSAGIGAAVAVLGVAVWLLFGQATKKIDDQGTQIAGLGEAMQAFRGSAESRMAAERERHDKELAELKGSLDEDRRELARLVVDRQERATVLAELRQRQDLSEKQRKELEQELQAKLDSADRELGKLNDRIGKASQSAGSQTSWAELAQAMEPGIFLIVAEFTGPKLDPFTGKGLKGKDGKYVYNPPATGIGTGFCIRGDGLLATNAHVVLMLEEIDGVQIRSRRAYQSGTGDGFEIQRFARHPGWTPLPGGITRAEPDVGLIQLRDFTVANVPVLVLATEEELRKLGVGTEIGTLGFPGEFLREYLADSSATKVPRAHATFKNGFVGRLLSYDKEQRDFEHAHYIQHSCLTSGGTSGSPLFDRAGKVIGINHASADGTGGLRFGIRADEISDFWDELKRTRKGEGW